MKNIRIFLSEIFLSFFFFFFFFVVKFSVYLNRHVFVMGLKYSQICPKGHLY